MERRWNYGKRGNPALEIGGLRYLSKVAWMTHCDEFD
jgi:hypothetical protein